MVINLENRSRVHKITITIFRTYDNKIGKETEEKNHLQGLNIE
jgi:hypothetical protein